MKSCQSATWVPFKKSWGSDVSTDLEKAAWRGAATRLGRRVQGSPLKVFGWSLWVGVLV